MAPRFQAERTAGTVKRTGIRERGVAAGICAGRQNGGEQSNLFQAEI